MNASTLEVRPCRAKGDFERPVDYFHGASDESLLAMGADRAKFPARDLWVARLVEDAARAASERQWFHVLWCLEGEAIGHSNAAHIVYGEHAFVHLHVWDRVRRRSGLGLEFFRRSVRLIATELRLKEVICEPYAHNPGPNRVLERAGFQFVKCHRTTPGPINFEQEVNRWVFRVGGDDPLDRASSHRS